MKRVSELTDHTGYWVRQVSNHVSQAFARKLLEQEVTVAEWVIMRVMYGCEDLPPSQIAERMGMTRGAVTKLADRLIEKGLIARKADRGDKRSHSLRLTAQALRLVPALAVLADQNDAECFSHLSAKERDFLLRILKRTVEQLGIAAVPMT